MNDYEETKLALDRETNGTLAALLALYLRRHDVKVAYQEMVIDARDHGDPELIAAVYRAGEILRERGAL